MRFGDIGRYDDVAQLERLVGKHRHVVVEAVAFEREHVGRPVDIAPFAVQLVNGLVCHEADRSLGRVRLPLALDHEAREAFDVEQCSHVLFAVVVVDLNLHE